MVWPPAPSLASLHHGLVLCLFLTTRFPKYIHCYLFMHPVACYELMLLVLASFMRSMRCRLFGMSS